MIARYQQRAEQTVTGFQSPCDDHLEGRLNIVDKLVIDEPNTFYIQMNSDKMKGFGINCGDIIVTDKSLQALSNCIILVWYRAEFYVRKYVRGPSITLIDDTGFIQPNPGEELIIWGVVTAICRGMLPPNMRQGRYKNVCAL